MCEVHDRFQNPMPGGYRDIQLVVQFQNHLCELQLSTEAMLRAKETTGHRDFDVMRELKAAVQEQDSDRVKSVLQFGLDHLGSKNLHEGSTNEPVDVDDLSKTSLKAMLQSVEARELLLQACRLGGAVIVKHLLLFGADANAASLTTGDTALHEAVFHGHQGCVWVVSCYLKDVHFYWCQNISHLFGSNCTVVAKLRQGRLDDCK